MGLIIFFMYREVIGGVMLRVPLLRGSREKNELRPLDCMSGMLCCDSKEEE